MPKHILTEHWFAKTYGWPPEIVRKLPLDSLHWFPLVAQAETRANKIRHDQHQHKRGRGR